ncbi:hypothetical protein BKA61DRAFT_699105 [Leptodontidium sp. MPI-SDFR-AT-0119]|nr:hypothetical protein BKA61DRAFT_699105 [Leptodontidium sp. MPI-SDFR-AT-0119]
MVIEVDVELTANKALELVKMSNPFESREQNSMRGPAGRGAKRNSTEQDEEHQSMYTQSQLGYDDEEEGEEEEYDGEDEKGEYEEWKEGGNEQPHPPPSKRQRLDPHTTTIADQSPSFATSGQSKALAASSSIHRSVTIKGQVYHINSGGGWLCTRTPCPKTFATKGGLERHVKDKHDSMGARYSCIICHRTFQEKHLVKRHQKTLSKNFSACNNAWYAGLVPGSPGYAGRLGDIPMVLPNSHPTPIGPTSTIPLVAASAGLPSDQNTPPIYGGSPLSNQNFQTREASSTLAQATSQGLPSHRSPVLYGPESTRSDMAPPHPFHGLAPGRSEEQRYDEDELEDPKPLGSHTVASEAQSFAPQHPQGFKQRTLAVDQSPAIHTIESHPVASQQLPGSVQRSSTV